MEEHFDIKMPFRQHVDITDTKIHIERKGFRAISILGKENLETEFPLTDIQTIKLKKPGISNGYVQFVCSSTNVKATEDSHTFRFNAKTKYIEQIVEDLIKELNIPTYLEFKKHKVKEIDKAKERILKNNAEKVGFIYFDFVDEKIIFDTAVFETKLNFSSVNFSDVVNFDVIDRNGSHVSKHHRGVRAVTGGLLAGSIGAVIGASTGGKEYDKTDELSIIIYFNDSTDKKIDFLKDQKSDGLIAEDARKKFNRTVTLLTKIINMNKNEIPSSSYKNELKELKSLLDDGIITQSEFDMKKKQILGL